jgi:PAS domain S-box-containing protein
MPALDMKTILFIYVIINIIITIILMPFCLQNKARFRGINLWLYSYLMQTIGFLLIFIGGATENPFVIALGSPVTVAAIIVLFTGLKNFVGKEYPGLHNYLLFLIFLIIHVYYSIFDQDLTLRTINIYTMLMVLTIQVFYYLFFKTDKEMRPVTRNTGLVFLGLSVVSFLRVLDSLLTDNGNVFFETNGLPALFILVTSMLYILLTFTLITMLNSRLIIKAIEDEKEKQGLADDVLKAIAERIYIQSERDALIDISYDLMCIANAKGYFKFINPAWEKVLGYTKEELLTRPFLSFIHPDDHGKVDAVVESLKTGNRVSNYEDRYIHKDGTIRDILWTSAPSEDGREFYGIGKDITERKAAEEKLKKLEERLRIAHELSLDAFTILSPVRDSSGTIVDFTWDYVNPEAGRILKHEPEYLTGRRLLDVLPGNKTDSDLFRRYVHLAETGEPYDYELLYESEGIKGWFRNMGVRTGDSITVSFSDITGRKQIENDLKASEKRFLEVAEQVQEWIWETDAEGKYTYANQVVEKILGYTPDEIMKKHFYDLFLPEIRESLKTTALEFFNSKEPFRDFINCIVHKNGQHIWFSTCGFPMLDENGTLLGYRGVDTNITEQMIMNRERELNSNRLQALLQLNQMYTSTNQEITSFALEEAVRLTQSKIGYLAFLNEDESILTMYSWSKTAMEECAIADKPKIYPVANTGLWGEAIRQRRPIITNDYSACSTLKKGYPDGHVAIKRHMNIPVFDGSRIVLVAGVGNKAEDYDQSDVQQLTLLMEGMWMLLDRRRALDALIESEENLRLTRFCIDHASDSIFLADPDAAFHYVNETTCNRLGYSKEELLQMTVFDIDPAFPKDSWRQHWMDIKENLSFTIETFHKKKTGEIYPVEVTVNYITYGGKEFIFAFAKDVTVRKHLEEERINLEKQLFQAQKMESLGILAGGVAHDFNNILMAIMGNAELGMLKTSDVSPVRSYFESINKASIRAADLCRQMLAYSGKGRFVIQAVNLSEVIEEVNQMLKTSVSKKADIRLDLAKGLAPIEADLTQIQQAIINLVINASEAIGDAIGIINIKTSMIHCNRKFLEDNNLQNELKEGHYACLEVSDTGCGMDKETVSKIFDPFFSTKFTGRGLGLSAVQGIMRGHRGAITVFSTPGNGTTFKLLFPSAVHPHKVSGKSLKEPGENSRGRVLILLVDDEEAIRSIGKIILEDLGFKVLVAADGGEALDVFNANINKITCVLLDLTMPNMDGEETFMKLRFIKPQLPIIVSSGYNEQEVLSRFEGKNLTGFIQKPYTINSLMNVLKNVLG